MIPRNPPVQSLLALSAAAAGTFNSDPALNDSCRGARFVIELPEVAPDTDAAPGPGSAGN